MPDAEDVTERVESPPPVVGGGQGGGIPSRTVTAAVLRERSGPFQIESLHLDAPRAREVVVRIVASGICHTDLSARDQVLPFRLPAVLGHEGAGIVEQVGGEVTSVHPGDRVVLSFASCGACSHCRDDHVAYCQHAARLNFGGVRLDGASVLNDADGRSVSGFFLGQSSFATHVLANESSVVPIAADVPLELMGPLGCGMQTGAGTIANLLKPRAGNSLAIFGTGSVGLAALMAARIAGCTPIIAVDINDVRLKLAAELGAHVMLNAASGNIVQGIRAATAGRGVDFSVECTGRPEVLREAIDALAACGTCALVGAAHPSTEVSVNMAAMLRGRSLRGVTEGDSVPQQFIPQLIEWWREGRFPFERLVQYFEFEQINEAVAACASGTVIKPIVKMPRHDAAWRPDTK